MLNNKNFIVFSDEWGRHPFSCQHIMQHFLPGNRVLWVNTIGLRTPRLSVYDIKRSLEKIGGWLKPRKAASKRPLPQNLHVISPVMLPFNNIPFIRALNKESVLQATRKAMREWGMQNPILLTTLPTAADYIGSLDEELIVYYCVDDFTLWPGMNQPKMVKEMEDTLLQKADLVVAVSQSLCASRTNGRTATQLLTHGVDLEHFNHTEKAISCPEELAGLGHPLIGFYGLIDKHFDVQLMARLLEAKPGWTFVCIGTKRIDLGVLEAHSNFKWLPAMPYARLPEAAACFDAAIIPYIVNAHTSTANPLKLREYIATGKPVVSTPMPEVFRFAEHIKIAGDAKAFANAIEESLHDELGAAAGRLRSLEGESWSDKANTLSGWLQNSLAQKYAGVKF